MDLPTNASRDDILAALEAVPESDQATRTKLMHLFAAAPPRPAIRMRHGARPGEVETFEDGHWISPSG